MAEPNIDELAHEAPLKLVNFINELYKTLRDKKQQEQQQKAQQDQQEALQKQQQQFMTEQNERLIDAMQQAGVPATDKNNEVAKTGLNRLERLAETEIQNEQQMEVLEGQIAEIDSEQQELLAGKVDQSKEMQAKIDDLDKQKLAANEMYEKNRAAMLKQNPPDQKQLDALKKQKEEFDKQLKQQRDEAVKTKAGLDDPTKRLGELDQQMKQAEDTFQQKSEDLMKKPGVTPDEYFEGMEKLKAEKAETLKGLEAEKDQLKKHQKPDLTPKEKQDKLQALHEKKAGLLQDKGKLQEKMKGLQTEKNDLMKAKGIDMSPKEKPSNWQVYKDRVKNAEFGYGIKGESKGKAVFMGGFDLLKKSLSKPNSVAASLLKEKQESGKGLGEELAQSQKRKVPSFKH